MSESLHQMELILQEAEPDKRPQNIILVDGSGYIFRAYHALRGPNLTTSEGTPVGAVYGFCSMLIRLMDQFSSHPMAVIFDKGRLTFRNRIYVAYKAHRPEPPEDLIPQFPLVREATEAFGLPSIELEGWEADDLLASYAKAITAQGGKCMIVSSDKDLMQLVRPGVEMLDPMKDDKIIGPAEVEERFGVPPEKVIDVQALMGDSADNVPGVPGIGPKGAAQLVQEYGGLDAVLAAAPSMKLSKRRSNLLEFSEQALLSRRLVTLNADVPLPVPPEDFKTLNREAPELRPWLQKLGFKSLIPRLEKTHRSSFQSPVGQAVPFTGASPVEKEPGGDLSGIMKTPYGPYEILQSDADLVKWFETIGQAGKVAVFPQPRLPGDGSSGLGGVGLAVRPGEACYVPWRGDAAFSGAAMQMLGKIFADPTVLCLFQEAKEARALLENAGIKTAGPVDDVQLISYAQSMGAYEQTLETLSVRHLSHDLSEYGEPDDRRRMKTPLEDYAPEFQARYCAGRADAVLRLWEILQPRLRLAQALALYETIDRPLQDVLGRMERRGVRIDPDELQNISREFSERMERISQEIFAEVGHAFSLGSPKQLGQVLFEELGLPSGKKTRNGAWSTDREVLETLAAEGHPVPAKVLEWRQLDKLKNTYADALFQQMDPRTNRVHTHFQMALTTTGRLSSTDPNLQNIPIRTEEGTRIRRAIVARPGYSLISADYSQIELRLMASIANVPSLIEAFRNGQDIHAKTASEVFGIPLEAMDPATRRNAKAINFGIIYGISPFGLARQLRISQREAKTYIEAYFQRYPEIRTYMENTIEQAKRDGFVRTPWGRKCFVPGFKNKIPAVRAGAERQAINAPLQGGAADIIKRAMVQLEKTLENSGLDARMVLQVHDELLIEAKTEQAQKVAELVKEVMERAGDFLVPLTVETGIGADWASAH